MISITHRRFSTVFLKINYNGREKNTYDCAKLREGIFTNRRVLYFKFYTETALK